MAKRLFQQSLSDHCVGRSLSFEKVVAYSPRGSLSHKRICLLYSVVKELWRKRVAFMLKHGQSKKEGIEQIMLCGYCLLFFFDF